MRYRFYGFYRFFLSNAGNFAVSKCLRKYYEGLKKTCETCETRKAQNQGHAPGGISAED